MRSGNIPIRSARLWRIIFLGLGLLLPTALASRATPALAGLFPVGSDRASTTTAAVLPARLVVTPTASSQGSDRRTFPETGKTVSGLFLTYWNAHGALAQQGYPISDPFVEPSALAPNQRYEVQYFERAVFERHPENAGTPYEVLLTQLGTYRYQARYGGAGAPGQMPNQVAGNSHFFTETGHWVGGVFWQYWQAHGGLAQQGYPLSEEFTEASTLDPGQRYTVQYFERAVFEYHPTNAPPYNVLLAQLGTFQYKEKYANPPTPTPSPGPAAPPAEGRVDVGGYSLYYRCSGQGRPTILMEAGLGTTSSTWAGVQPELARRTRVCVYDRANLGKSDRGPTPRTSLQIAKELRTLLQTAQIPGPYVVVGHSQGGLHMLLFAELYKQDIAGIVSIDGAPPDISTRYQAVLTPAQYQQYQDLVAQNAEGVTYDAIRASEAQVQAQGPLPDVPFRIVRHGRDTPQPAGWPVAALEQAWRAAQEALAASTPQGRVILAPNSGHFIQQDQPQLVIDTIQEVVDQARLVQ